MPRLLVVDDEPNVLYSLEAALRSEALEVITARTAKEGLERLRQEPPDAVILDVRLPDLSGLEAFERIRQIDPRLCVILITAYASTETAIEAMKRGAFDYLLKPVDLHQLREVVARAVDLNRLRHIPAVFEALEESNDTVDRIVGQSAAMQDVYKAVGRVAPQDLTVLITGESGTGKELVARAIYHHSRRAQKPFLAINCAAIPESLLESELFGHERGAFTGADRRRVGKFEQAHHGTIFLDEIGDMTPATQAKVLRLLQEQRFERLGGNATIQTDVRVIAATNQDLEVLVAAGRFRQDLFYRLKVFSIHLPPLRERMEDLPVLADYFVKRGSRELGKQVRAIHPEAMRLLERHTWPGNVRELQSTLKYALVHARGEILMPDCLPDMVRRGQRPMSPPEDKTECGPLDVSQMVRDFLKSGQSDIYERTLAAVDRVVLSEVLSHVNGNQVQAAQLLGISRTTLRARLRTLGLSIEKQCSLEAGQSDQNLYGG